MSVNLDRLRQRFWEGGHLTRYELELIGKTPGPQPPDYNPLAEQRRNEQRDLTIQAQKDALANYERETRASLGRRGVSYAAAATPPRKVAARPLTSRPEEDPFGGPNRNYKAGVARGAKALAAEYDLSGYEDIPEPEGPLDEQSSDYERGWEKGVSIAMKYLAREVGEALEDMDFDMPDDTEHRDSAGRFTGSSFMDKDGDIRHVDAGGSYIGHSSPSSDGSGFSHYDRSGFAGVTNTSPDGSMIHYGRGSGVRGTSERDSSGGNFYRDQARRLSGISNGNMPPPLKK